MKTFRLRLVHSQLSPLSFFLYQLPEWLWQTVLSCFNQISRVHPSILCSLRDCSRSAELLTPLTHPGCQAQIQKRLHSNKPGRRANPNLARIGEKSTFALIKYEVVSQYCCGLPSLGAVTEKR